MGTGWRRAFCTSIKRNPESPTSNIIPITTTDNNNKHQQRRSSSAKESQSQSPTPTSSAPSTPRSFIRFGFRSSSSTPKTSSSTTPKTTSSTPITNLRCRTTVGNTTTTAASAPSSLHNSPRLHCKTSPTFSTSTVSTPNTNSTIKTQSSSVKTTPRLFTSSSSAPSSPKSPSRFSLFKSSLRLTKNSCGVCLQSMKSGAGTAIFTAECSHSFHFPCIASHVKKHGSLVCPVCSTNWREVPLLALHKNQKKPEEIIKTVDDTKKQSQKASIYDDDEPLSSSPGGGRFNTIPEVDEEEEENDEEIKEFQGFFVDPNLTASFKSDSSFEQQQQKPSSSPKKISCQIIRHVEVKLLPVSAVISVGRSHETIAVAIKVKAPPPPARTSSASLLDPTRRAPIDLVTVLDVSGSMTGEKLLMLKRAMRLVISSLGSCDRLSIIAFSSIPKRLLPLRRMSSQGQKCARRIIDRLVIGQGSSVGDALRKATKVLEDRRERNPVASIMLLSDGHDEEQDNQNQNQNQNQQQHGSSKTRFSHMEIPVAENHQEPTEDAFAKCVGGLLSVVVHDLRLQLGFYSGSAPAEIAAVYSCTGKPTLLGSNSIRLGDLYAEEERELLVELKVPILKQQQSPSQYIMSIRSCYKDPATQEVVFGKDQPLLVPGTSSIKSSAVSKIERLRNLFITTRAVAEARRLIQHNDLSNAFHLLNSTKSLLQQSNSDDSEYLVSLENELIELHWRRQNLLLQQQQQQQFQYHYHQQQIQRRVVNEREPVFSVDENAEPLTPTSAWRAAEKLAKVAIMRKSMNRVSDLHGFENARF
ncbi:hypothetical protein C5167_039966 [Papaver somniferum]|uniref:RING-type domain-containing protein n=1 Tax=Papaver somniferum TaxID=3469 RepID=A0A4Y7IH55_PAPSO|nr:E3 ubiquitin-protein ligase WAV3-like [Papaver somniferum]RZC47022.1 hypothetical protein C5167_039966 [Papaver somniferum]